MNIGIHNCALLDAEASRHRAQAPRLRGLFTPAQAFTMKYGVGCRLPLSTVGHAMLLFSALVSSTNKQWGGGDPAVTARFLVSDAYHATYTRPAPYMRKARILFRSVALANPGSGDEALEPSDTVRLRCCSHRRIRRLSNCCLCHRSPVCLGQSRY